MPSNLFWAVSIISGIVFTIGIIKRIKELTRNERLIFLYTLSQASGTTAIITGSILIISLWLGPGYYPETVIGELKTIDTLIAVTFVLGSIAIIGLIDWLWRGMPQAKLG